jgi:2-dehydropantoate 2-reductase
MSAVAQEGIAVAKAQGVELEKDPEEMINDSIPVAYRHKPSMLQDVEAKRTTEIDTINGGVASIGERIGVPCPINRAIADMVKGLEHSWTLEDNA